MSDDVLKWEHFLNERLDVGESLRSLAADLDVASAELLRSCGIPADLYKQTLGHVRAAERGVKVKD
jgi:hypothetical protein